MNCKLRPGDFSVDSSVFSYLNKIHSMSVSYIMVVSLLPAAWIHNVPDMNENKTVPSLAVLLLDVCPFCGGHVWNPDTVVAWHWKIRASKMIHSETNVEDQLRKIAADFAMFDCQRLKMFLLCICMYIYVEIRYT